MGLARRIIPIAGVLLSVAGPLDAQRVVMVRPDALRGTDVGDAIPEQESFLQSMLKLVDEPMTLHLVSGVYNLKPESFIPPDGSGKPKESTAGLIVSHPGLRLEGDSAGAVILVAHSPVGVLFKDCEDCGISGVTILIRVGRPGQGMAVVGINSVFRVDNCRVIVEGESQGDPGTTCRLTDLPSYPPTD